MAGKIISITISESNVKICEVTAGKSGVSVHKAIMVETPQGAYEDGYLRNIEEMGRMLKKTLAAAKMNSKDIAFSIYSSRIASRDVLIPYVKDNKINDVIQTNATEYFPVNIEDYIITYKVKSTVEGEDGKQLSVLVYAAPENMVAEYYELGEILGRNIVSVDYAGNSSAQLMRKQLGILVSLVIHVEREYSMISVFKEGVLRIQRVIPYGKDLVVDTMKNEKNISEEEVNSILAVERVIHNTFDGDVVTESLRHLVNNVNRVVDYYNTRYSEEPIEAAYLTGESVELLGLENLCANEFKFSVMQIMNLNNVTVAKDLFHSTVSKYALNIGAVVNPCNFVAKKAAVAEHRKSNMKFFRLSLLLAIFVSLVLVLVPIPAYVDTVFKLGVVKKGINDIVYVQDEVDDYYAYKDAHDDMQVFYDSTINNNSTLSKYIADMERVMPSDMSVKVMNIANGAVSITGETSSKESVARYLIEIKSLPYVTNAFVSTLSETISDDGVVGLSFSITYNITGYEEPTTEEVTTEEATTENETGEVE